MRREIFPQRLFLILGVALLLAPLVLPESLARLGVSEGAKAQENRLKTPMPQLSLAGADFKAYAAQLTKAYPETFPFRDWMIRTGNILKMAVFRQSPSRNIVMGRNGWFFYDMEMDLEDWLGVDLYSPEELAKAKEVLTRRRDWLAARGISFLVVVPPNKNAIYGEFMPRGFHKLAPITRLDQLSQALREAGIPFLDLRPALLEAKAVRRAYWKTDSHWNGWGAFMGSRAIVEALSRIFPAMKPLRPEDYRVSESVKPGGDLTAMLLLEGIVPEQAIDMVPLSPGRSRPALAKGYANPATLSGRDMVIRETDDPSLPKAVIFRDSFSSAAWPFLAERFRRSVFLWEHRFKPDIVLAEKPDVVIYEVVERYQNALFGFPEEALP
jgi:hypothetical protein